MKHLTVSFLAGAGFSFLALPAQSASLEFGFEVLIDAVNDAVSDCPPAFCIPPTSSPIAVGDVFTGSGTTTDLTDLTGQGTETLGIDRLKFNYIDFFTGLPEAYTEVSFALSEGNEQLLAVFQEGEFVGVEGVVNRVPVGNASKFGYAAFRQDAFEGFATDSDFDYGLLEYRLDYVADGTVNYFSTPADIAPGSSSGHETATGNGEPADSPMKTIPEPSMALGLVAVLGAGLVRRQKRLVK